MTTRVSLVTRYPGQLEEQLLLFSGRYQVGLSGLDCLPTTAAQLRHPLQGWQIVSRPSTSHRLILRPWSTARWVSLILTKGITSASIRGWDDSAVVLLIRPISRQFFAPLAAQTSCSKPTCESAMVQKSINLDNKKEEGKPLRGFSGRQREANPLCILSIMNQPNKLN